MRVDHAGTAREHGRGVTGTLPAVRGAVALPATEGAVGEDATRRVMVSGFHRPSDRCDRWGSTRPLPSLSTSRLEPLPSAPWGEAGVRRELVIGAAIVGAAVGVAVVDDFVRDPDLAPGAPRSRDREGARGRARGACRSRARPRPRRCRAIRSPSNAPSAKTWGSRGRARPWCEASTELLEILDESVSGRQPQRSPRPIAHSESPCESDSSRRSPRLRRACCARQATRLRRPSSRSRCRARPSTGISPRMRRCCSRSGCAGRRARSPPGWPSSSPGGVARAEVAGPGFVNVWLAVDRWRTLLAEILRAGPRFGACDAGKGRPIQVEFVSANPTGPLSVGHGRQAVLGDCIARLLEAAGWKVTREYYFNNGGRQMRVLGESVKARYLELLGRAARPPKDALEDPELPGPTRSGACRSCSRATATRATTSPTSRSRSTPAKARAGWTSRATAASSRWPRRPSSRASAPRSRRSASTSTSTSTRRRSTRPGRSRKCCATCARAAWSTTRGARSGCARRSSGSSATACS